MAETSTDLISMADIARLAGEKRGDCRKLEGAQPRGLSTRARARVTRATLRPCRSRRLARGEKPAICPGA